MKTIDEHMNSIEVRAAPGKIEPLLFERPNSNIGRSVPRPGAPRAVAGRGRYTDDIALPRMLHAAFFRSPHAHAKILRIDISKAAAQPGVVKVATGADIAKRCKPMVGFLSCFVGMKVTPQHAMAVDRACWQGEPVAIVVAGTRAQAEDAAELIEVEWEELPVVIEKETALGRDVVKASGLYPDVK